MGTRIRSRRGPPGATRRLGIACLALLFVASATGCLSGVLYHHTTRPLDVQFNETPSALGNAKGEARGESWKTLVIPLPYNYSDYGQLQFDWGDVSIAHAMHEAELERVHYADLETRSFLGIWTQRWVHVYGE